MFKVYLSVRDGALLTDRMTTIHPEEAELHYLQLCRTRTDAPAVVVVESEDTRRVAPGRYHTDLDWGFRDREEDPLRRSQLWAAPREGYRGPSPHQVRALTLMAGLTSYDAAALLGVPVDDWREWTDQAAEAQVMPWPIWFALLVRCGAHPDFPRASQLNRRVRETVYLPFVH